MNMKRYIKYAAAALAATTLMALGACTSIEQDPADLVISPDASVEGVPVALSAYTGRSTATRSGDGGILVNSDTPAEGELSLRTAGFGVFSYYHNDSYYDQKCLPDFMWNEQVTYQLGHWSYLPVKYWPNQSGADAYSVGTDRLSFFAYAPWVHATPANGSVDDNTYGITSLSRNTKAGDPIVGYRSTLTPAAGVDLCWGICDNAEWPVTQDNAVQHMTAGLPWIDVQRPQAAAGQYLTFGFHHALSQLNVQVDADIDVTAHATVPAVDGATKVYVRSVTFMGFALSGKLNLNNTVAATPLWLNDQATGALDGARTVTVYDGRLNGLEGVAAAGSGAEDMTGLNAAIISDDGNTTPGVTATAVNLFSSEELTDPIFVIPNGAPLTVTVAYDVETADEALKGELLSDNVTHGSRSRNTITKQVRINDDFLTLASGKCYTLKLHLGLTSVSFDAALGEWTPIGTQAYF